MIWNHTIISRTIWQDSASAVNDTSALESKIDRLVYQLYGLTEEELDFIIRSALPLA